MDKFRVTFCLVEYPASCARNITLWKQNGLWMAVDIEFNKSTTIVIKQDISLFIFSFSLELIELQNYYNIIYKYDQKTLIKNKKNLNLKSVNIDWDSTLL